jgi:hypothetical protein
MGTVPLTTHGTIAVSCVAEAPVTTADAPPILTVLLPAVGANPEPAMVTMLPGVKVAGETDVIVSDWARIVATDAPLFPSLAAVIVATPAFLAVNNPVDDTEATLVSDEVHVTARPDKTLP